VGGGVFGRGGGGRVYSLATGESWGVAGLLALHRAHRPDRMLRLVTAVVQRNSAPSHHQQPSLLTDLAMTSRQQLDHAGVSMSTTRRSAVVRCRLIFSSVEGAGSIVRPPSGESGASSTLTALRGGGDRGINNNATATTS